LVEVEQRKSLSVKGMGGQILGAMPENLAPCLSLRKIEFLGSGVEHDNEVVECDKIKKHCDSHRSAFV
jgi:hypothetical protein